MGEFEGEAGFELKSLGEGQVAAEVKGLFEGLDGMGIEGCEAAGKGLGFFIEEVRRYLAGYESVVEGLFRGETLACEKEVEGFGGADYTRDGLGATGGGDESEVGFGH